jgi:hypothetical protein
MDWKDEVGIADASDGVGVVVYLHLREGIWGLQELSFSTLPDAYRAIGQNISDIAGSEIHALYRPRGAKLLSSLVGNRNEWAEFFGHPIP